METHIFATEGQKLVTMKNITQNSDSASNKGEKSVITTLGEDLTLADLEFVYGRDSEVQELHKIEGVTALYLKYGEMEITIDENLFTVISPSLILFLPHQIVKLKSFTKRIGMTSVTISNKIVDDITTKAPSLEFLWLSILGNPIHHLSEADSHVFNIFLSTLKDSLSLKDNPFRYDTSLHLILTFYWGYLHKFFSPEITQNSKQIELTKNFFRLLRKHFSTKQNVNFYANALCISAKHLSDTIKDTTGFKIKDVISYHLLNEAKMHLQSSSLSIEEISYRLGFNSQSSFCRFFKRLSGKTPSEYRNYILSTKFNLT